MHITEIKTLLFKMHFFLLLILFLSACSAGSDSEQSSINRQGVSCRSTDDTMRVLRDVPRSGRNLFSWDCESLATSTGVGLGLQGATSISRDNVWQGSHSMRLDVRGDDNGNQSMGLIVSQGSPIPSLIDGGWLFYRFYMNIDAHFSWGTGTALTKANRITQIAEVHPVPLTGYMSRDGIYVSECPGCNLLNPGIVFNFQAMAGRGWHEYIVALKKQNGVSGSDGELHLFVDAQLIGSVYNMRYTDQDLQVKEAWGGWMVSPYFQLNGTQSDGGTIWIDQISTDTFWNSTIRSSSEAIETFNMVNAEEPIIQAQDPFAPIPSDNSNEDTSSNGSIDSHESSVVLAPDNPSLSEIYSAGSTNPCNL